MAIKPPVGKGVSRHKSSRQRALEKEIYDTFWRIHELLEEKRKKHGDAKVTIAEYLQMLDVSSMVKQDYRGIRFKYESFLKLVIFQWLKGIKQDTKLVRYLKRNSADKHKLGFKRAPHRTNINHFIKYLDEETKKDIDFIVSKSIELSEKYCIEFDYEALKKERPKRITTPGNQRFLNDKKAAEISHLLRKQVEPFIDFHQKKNVIYPKGKLLDLECYAALNHECAENGSRLLERDRGGRPCTGSALLYHMKKSTKPELDRQFEIANESLFMKGKKAGLIDPRKSVDIAIDCTDWPFWGNRKNSPMVVGKQPKDGTAWGYQFATCCIVENFDRLCLKTVSVSIESEAKVIGQLVTHARARVKINHVYLDRGFCKEPCFRMLDSLGVKYLMPAVHLKTVLTAMRRSPPQDVLPNFRWGNYRTNLVIVEDTEDGKKVKRAYVTNMEFDPKEGGLTRMLHDLYAKRWGIETKYRVTKYSFRPKTTSKNYIIRLFHFLFSMLLYNLWILTDLLLQSALYEAVGKGHKVTAKLICLELTKPDPG